MIKGVALLINAQGLEKTFGAIPLFREIGISLSDGDRLGLIGPNGSGKSTLLKILAGRAEADAGDVAIRKTTRLAYIAQDSQFTSGETVRSVVHRAFDEAKMPAAERPAREGETLGRVGFIDFDAEAATLSGGWRKRLAVAEALVQDPDVLLLDEPTNHLDLAGIEWLEGLLLNAPFASITISHDRYFLENVATQMAELNRIYPTGLLRVQGNYSTFLEKKDEYLLAQEKRQDALANRVRTEVEWLRRGPKARATKAKARIDKANEMIGELKDMQSRSRTANADIDFSATDRKTKRLIDLRQVSYGFEGRRLFKEIDFTITAGMRVGLVGPNGSGKTTFLRLVRGEMEPNSGEVRRADLLRVVYFDQLRRLDDTVTLRQALAPDGDSVVYQERTIHIASWASRFLFSNEQLNQPVGRLSGGERARVLIAKLMLEPADLLLLDEPTNDLDIPTLEILEESLLEFKGALVLVTHDRYMLDRVSTTILGLDGEGNTEQFADYSQWETWMEQGRQEQKAKVAAITTPIVSEEKKAPSKKKLSYLDSRDYQTIEDRIADAEKILAVKRERLEDPAVASDGLKIAEAYREVEDAQRAVDDLYARWAELEEKLA